MTEIRHISDREMALERENARLVDKTERQSATIHVQAVAIQAMKADADRYQWLSTIAYVGIAPYPKPHEVWCLRLINPQGCNSLDAAINAAMKETK